MTRLPAIVTFGVLLLAACTGPDPVMAPSREPTVTAGQVVHHIGARFEYAGVVVEIGDAVFDKNDGTYRLGARLTSVARVWIDSLLAPRLRVAGEDHPVSGLVATLPPGLSQSQTFVATGFDADPTATGELVVGDADEQQVVVQLADGGHDGMLPTDVDVDAWGQIGKYALHVDGGSLLSGYVDLNWQAPTGERVLRLDLEVFASRADPVNGFSPGSHLQLRRPDGAVVETGAASPVIFPSSWTLSTGGWVEFPVALDGDGDYMLLLSSLDPKGFSTFHPDLIATVEIPFALTTPSPAPAAPVEGVTAVLPTPDPSEAVDPGTSTTPASVSRELSAGAVGVPGFVIALDRLTWDRQTQVVQIEGVATYVETVSEQESGGVLDTAPQLVVTALLDDGRTVYGGSTSTDGWSGQSLDSAVVFEFEGVDDLDLDAAALLVGPRSTAAATVPLGPASGVAPGPAPPVTYAATSPTASAGGWSARVVALRVGRLQGTLPPPPGRVSLEVVLDVTRAADAKASIFGTVFRPQQQVFLQGPGGYLVQASTDAGSLDYANGQTQRQSVTFTVPEGYVPTELVVVLRSTAEVAGEGGDTFVETAFTAVPRTEVGLDG